MRCSIRTRPQATEQYSWTERRSSDARESAKAAHLILIEERKGYLTEREVRQFLPACGRGNILAANWMKRTKSILLIALAAMLVVAMSGCARVQGIIAPLEGSEEEEASVAFENAGISVQAAQAAGVAMFQYKFQQPVSNMRVWAEMYYNGQLSGEPVEINQSNLTEDNGIIAFFTETAEGQPENFALFASNGMGPQSKAQVQIGSLNVGDTLSPAAQSSIEETQLTELGMQNVLLVLHDGPKLDTQMTNDVNEVEQLMASSTYTLVVYCQFS